jgi:hypothetical protein
LAIQDKKQIDEALIHKRCISFNEVNTIPTKSFTTETLPVGIMNDWGFNGLQS